MVVFPHLAVQAKRSRLRSEVIVVRDERSGVAHRTEVLGWIEAERCRASDASGAEAVALRRVRLACVLDDLQRVCLCHARQCAHVSHLPVEVDRHDVRCIVSCTLRLLHVDVVIGVGDIDDHRHATGLKHGLECGGERHRGDDHPGARRKTGGDK